MVSHGRGNAGQRKSPVSSFWFVQISGKAGNWSMISAGCQGVQSLLEGSPSMAGMRMVTSNWLEAILVFEPIGVCGVAQQTADHPVQNLLPAPRWSVTFHSRGSTGPSSSAASGDLTGTMTPPWSSSLRDGASQCARLCARAQVERWACTDGSRESGYSRGKEPWGHVWLQVLAP